MKFLAKDKDKDEWKDNCVKERKGAWWYKRCFESSLNDVYYQNPKYCHLHLLTMVSNGKPGKTTLKYSFKKNEVKVCPANLHQTRKKKLKKKKTKERTVVIYTK